MIDVLWFVKRATYMPHCYMCYQDGQLKFHFFPSPPSAINECRWQSVRYLRNASRDVQQFDQYLYQNLSMVVRDPHTNYKTQAQVWDKFQSIFTALNGLFSYVPVAKAYYQHALEVFDKDNVMYLEIRALLLPMYELDGTTRGRDWVLKMLYDISKSFQKMHPDFMGVKIIFTSSRGLNKTVISGEVEEAIRLHQTYPDFVVGYDLVAREDAGHTLIYFRKQLLKPTLRNPPFKLPYFFHAGETNWNQEDVDDNLIDAILLNTSRIGHGFALTKHPKVTEYITKKGIAVEVNPISNQVLLLVNDMRNHPASALLAHGAPLVVSCDDPGLWGATGVTYDWYEFFMGIAGATDDLRLLKRLAMDSIKYSAMSEQEKSKAMEIWQAKWTDFIHRASFFFLKNQM